jgi:hypothetical protein
MFIKYKRQVFLPKAFASQMQNNDFLWIYYFRWQPKIRTYNNLRLFFGGELQYAES